MVKLSEVIRQMDVVITCTGTVPHAVTSITSALIITVFPRLKFPVYVSSHLNAKMLLGLCASRLAVINPNLHVVVNPFL